MLINDLNYTIDIWIKALEQYDNTQLRAQPAPHSWSIGQVYMHLIHNTEYFLEQVKICTSTNEHATEEASPEAKKMFFHNAFPDAIIEGPPENADTPQPDSKEQLMDRLLALKAEINKAGILISQTPYKGKTKHPGLHYFSASEWYQFAEMHLCHHIRQKKRIDDHLRINAWLIQRT